MPQLGYNVEVKHCRSTICFFRVLLVLLIALAVSKTTVLAQAASTQTEIILIPDLATASGSTTSASLASPSAEVEQKIQEKKDQDLTDAGGKQKSKLATFLDENPPEPLSWNNFMQYAIRFAVREGVPANTIVLVLLFPLVAALIAASRHVIGLRGFGIYIPAVLSVALVSTGIFEGIMMFVGIILTALVAKHFIAKLKLSYLPRTGLLLWTISLGIFATLVLAPLLNLISTISVNIFPILILVLLAENFLDAQTRTKQSEAIALTLETLGLALVSGLILKWEPLQQLVLLEPELMFIGTAALNIIIGKFVGLRLSERMRFRSIIEEE